MSTTDWREIYTDCPLCHSPKRKCVGTRGGTSHWKRLGVKTTVVKCGNCSLLYTHPTLLPLHNPYDQYSPEDYFQNHQSQIKQQKGLDYIKKAEKLLGRKGRVLEIGCGRGESLVAAKQRGWDVSGIEMTSSFAEVARQKGLQIIQADIYTLEDLGGPYDAILLPAILEHLYHPGLVLKKIHEALSSDGVVFIDVPNESSLLNQLINLCFHCAGKDWCLNMSPTFKPFHVIGFNKTSIAWMAQKFGFKIESLQSVSWRVLRPNQSLKSKILHKLAKSISIAGNKLGMGEGIMCWLRKTPD